MRRSCSARMLRSMVRSTVENPVSSGVEASSTTWRSSRTDPAFQPNSVRMARNSQPSALGRITSPGVTTAGKLGVLRGLSWVGSESGISIHPSAVGIGIGDAEMRQDLRFERFHLLRVVVVLVVEADQMQETMHGEVAQMMVERLLLLVRLAPHGLVGDCDVAEHAWRVARLPPAFRLERGKRQHVGRLV